MGSQAFTVIRFGNGAYFKIDLEEGGVQNKNQTPHIIKPSTCACVHLFPRKDHALCPLGESRGGDLQRSLNDSPTMEWKAFHEIPVRIADVSGEIRTKHQPNMCLEC
jgi:hypothetical protein